MGLCRNVLDGPALAFPFLTTDFESLSFTNRFLSLLSDKDTCYSPKIGISQHNLMRHRYFAT